MIYVALEQHKADSIRSSVGLVLFWLDRIKSCDKDEKEVSHIMDLIKEQAEAAHSTITEVMKPCLTLDELTKTVLTPCLYVKNEATEENE